MCNGSERLVSGLLWRGQILTYSSRDENEKNGGHAQYSIRCVRDCDVLWAMLNISHALGELVDPASNEVVCDRRHDGL